MGLLQPYQGTYVAATSASSKLDVETILAGCDAVDAEASHISDYLQKLAETTSTMDAKALCVNGQTMQNTMDEYSTNIYSVETEIMNITAWIRETVEVQYNNLQEQLNYDAQLRDQNEYAKQSRR